jgi:hypothetical protein
MSKKLFIFLVVFIIFSFSKIYSQNLWKKVLSNDQYNLFIDENIRSANNRIFFIAKRDYIEKKELDYELFWYIFDCNEKKSFLYIHIKKNIDKKEEEEKFEEVNYQNIAKDSEIEFLYNYLCSSVNK